MNVSARSYCVFKRLPIVFLFLFFLTGTHSYASDTIAAAPAVDILPVTALDTAEMDDRIETKTMDSLRAFITVNRLGHKKFLPGFNVAENKFVLRNQKATFGRKFIRGGGLVLSMQWATYGLMFTLPESISNWDHSQLEVYGQNMKEAFTKPPVLDEDHWYVNYVGHPIQGSWYYNAYRSQGAPWWQSGLMSTAHSFFWEYVIESGMERPSIQDLIVTPIAGSLLGELFHFSSMRMARNGYRWYEAATVCLINPMFAVNNGFKFPQRKIEY